MAGEPAHLMRAREAASVARSMACAFEADPMASHLLPDPATRRAKLERAFRLFLKRLYLPDGNCYTIGDADGGALWLSPGAYPPSAAQQIRMLPGLARVFGLSRLPAALRDLAQMESIHPKRAPHWYLGFLGVAPAKQGRGLGTRLLEPVLRRCDAEGTAAYLETSNPANLALYSRHGFEVIAECDIRSGPHVWGMWREPRR
jgi:ribosomal protein S18 acetylase RimI-like enzyme